MPPTQHCMVFPNVSGASQHYFLDTGMVLDQHSAPVIISDVAVVEMAKMFGFVSRGEAEQMQEKLDAKEATINELLQKVDDLEKFKGAVTLISNEKKKAIAAEKAVV
jgi:hypothetical protein